MLSGDWRGKKWRGRDVLNAGEEMMEEVRILYEGGVERGRMWKQEKVKE